MKWSDVWSFFRAAPTWTDRAYLALAGVAYLGVMAIAKWAPDDPAKRAWLELQARKARREAKARKLKAREERKRLRRAACKANANLAAQREALRWVSKFDRRYSLDTPADSAYALPSSEEDRREYRTLVRDCELAYAAHCAAVGAVPKVEA